MNARAAKTTELPSVDVLNRLFVYDDVSGVLLWRKRDGVSADWNTRYAGTIAGAEDKLGRRRLHLDGRHYRVHRLIFKMRFGTEPGVIDHINGNPSDNRIENLRAVNVQQNNRNRRPTGNLPKGVVKTEVAFGASIKIDGKSIWLGTYDTPEEAHAAYRGAAIICFGSHARFE